MKRATRRLRAYQQLLQEMPKTSEEMHTFHEQTIGDKVSGIALSLAVAMTAPVPGSMEIWMASSVVILMKADVASRFLVVEHSKDSSVEEVLGRFGSYASAQTTRTLETWNECKKEATASKVALVHNATSSTVALMYRQATSSKAAKILQAHPVLKIVNKAVGREDPLAAGRAVMIPPSEIAMVHLPDNQEENRELVFRQPNSDQDIGECKLSAFAIVSFVSIDSGLRVCNQKPATGEDYAPISSMAIANDSLDAVTIKVANPEAASGSDAANKGQEQQLKLEMVLQAGAKLFLDVQQAKDEEDYDEEDALANQEELVAPACYNVEVQRSAVASSSRKAMSACELRGGQLLKIEEGF